MAKNDQLNQRKRDIAAARRVKVADLVTQEEQSKTSKRRGQVESLLLSGASQRSIAKTLNVSHQTINNDIKALRQEWAKAAIHKIDVAVMTDMKRLDRLLLALWPRATKERDLASIEQVRRIIETKARVMGYDFAAILRDADEEADRQAGAKGKVTRITTIEVVKNYASDEPENQETTG